MKFSPRQDNLQRRRLWSFLSLWALLALTMPQMMWACPMTGKVASTPEQACTCAAQAKTSATNSSADTAHSCCDRVPLPTSDTAGQDEKGLLSQSRLVSFEYQMLAVPSAFFAPAAYEICAPLTQKAAFPPTTSPPLISQQSPFLHSGRAPPL